MTGYFVNTFAETPQGDAYDLTGAGDTLLVTSAGSLVTLSAGDGIDSTGSSEQITLDGLAYSAANFGVFVGGTYTNLVVNGDAQSGTSSGIACMARPTARTWARKAKSADSSAHPSKTLKDGALTNDGHITGSLAGVIALSVERGSGDE